MGGINLFSYVANNPVSGVDPLGLFSNHAVLGEAAFYNEKCKELSSKAASVAGSVDTMDGSQAPENAHWHAMSNGRMGESTESARRRTEDYINGQLSRCNADGLGRALHAEQDKYTAGHRGYQPWYGGISLKHTWKDEFGGGEPEAVAASVALIKRFKEMCPCACGR